MLPTAPLPSARLPNDAPLTLQPVRPTTGVIDVLSEFIPGEKVIALIQMQLANGAYRATIAQRDVTLALPFSAKPGDALDLEVVQTEGRIAFAIARPQAPAAAAAQSSATTTLSSTGQLIARLLSDAGQTPGQAAVLNGNRPVLGSPAAPAQANAPVLQKAVAASGLFYESHQSDWVAGKTTEAALRAEPQALIARALQTSPANALPPGLTASPASNAAGSSPSPSQAAAQPPDRSPGSAAAPAQPGTTAAENAGSLARPMAAAGMTRAEAGQAADASAPAAPATGTDGQKAGAARSALPGELAPLVQQQLASLASNIYSFQGMIWAGQPFHWEIIDEDGERPRGDDEEQARPWKTRLKMLLPSLGDIDATVQLDGSEVTISMTSGTGGTAATLDAGRERLRQRMELAGLRLMALDIRANAVPLVAGGPDEPPG
jgi:hypothetical protein